MEVNLRHKFAQGFRWNVIGQIGTNIVQVCSTVIVSRKLSPSDFSIPAIGFSITAILMVIFGRGFAKAIVPKQAKSQDEWDSIFVFYSLIGISAVIVLFLLSPFLSTFYSLPDLPLVLVVLSLQMFFNIFSYLPSAILEMHFEFKKINLVMFTSSLLGNILAISLALAGYGYWALVVPAIVGSFYEAVAYFILSGYRPKFRFSLQHFKKFTSYGFSSTCTDIFNVAVNKGDYLTMGRVWTKDQLGLYFFAYEKSIKPFEFIFSKFSSLLFPALSSFGKDRQRIQQAFLRITEIGTIIIFPLTVVLVALADQFIPLFFGQQWSPAVVLFQIFVAGWFMKAFGTGVGTCLYAMDKPQYAVINASLRFVLHIPFFLICMKRQASPLVVSLGLLVIAHLCMAIYYYIGIRIIEVKILDLLKIARKPFFVSALMLGIILGLRALLDGTSLPMVVKFGVPFVLSGLTNIWFMRKKYWSIYENYVVARPA